MDLHSLLDHCGKSLVIVHKGEHWDATDHRMDS